MIHKISTALEQGGAFLWIIFVIDVSCFSYLSAHSSLVVTCWERDDLLALLHVVFYCALSLSHVVRCGAWLYRFLVLPSFLLLIWKYWFCLVWCLTSHTYYPSNSEQPLSLTQAPPQRIQSKLSVWNKDHHSESSRWQQRTVNSCGHVGTVSLTKR